MMPRIPRLLSAALLPVVACGTSVASSDDRDAGHHSDAFVDSPAEPDAGNGVVCVTDQDCNNGPPVSLLQPHVCFSGFCFCVAGFDPRDVNGKCWPIPPPSCAKHDGQCQEAPFTCPAGALEGSFWTNQTCGDAGTGLCCIPEASCRGPADAFICCAPSGVVRAPICVNGWRTCPQNSWPTRESSCG